VVRTVVLNGGRKTPEWMEKKQLTAAAQTKSLYRTVINAGYDWRDSRDTERASERGQPGGVLNRSPNCRFNGTASVRSRKPTGWGRRREEEFSLAGAHTNSSVGSFRTAVRPGPGKLSRPCRLHVSANARNSQQVSCLTDSPDSQIIFDWFMIL